MQGRVAAGLCVGAIFSCRAPAPPPEPVPRTTSERLAFENLTAQRESASQTFRDDRSGKHADALVGVLLLEFQFTESVASLDRAIALAESPHVKPDADAFLARAAAWSAAHRFTQALGALDEAASRGADRTEVQLRRAALLLARGDPESASQLLRDLPDSPRSLALRARVEPDREAADQLLAQALAAIRDASPFPIAQLELQRGHLWEQAGDRPRAARHFRSAHERLPSWPAAAAHLAENEAKTLAEAIALVAPFDREDLPAYAGRLATLYALARDPVRAAASRDRARRGFARLLEAHPEAWADHAARFYLDAGRDPAEALRWASLNASVRSTPEARELASQAAAALGD